MVKQSKDEQIGFHKGALSVLSKEREEMQRIVSIVEQLIQMHISSLTDLGIDINKNEEAVKSEKKAPRKPIEDML